MAACMVAEPIFASASAGCASARLMLRWTIPISYMVVLLDSFPALLQRCVQPRKHAPRVAFEDRVLVLRRQLLAGIDVALGVVVVVAGGGIDTAHSADHLAG